MKVFDLNLLVCVPKIPLEGIVSQLFNLGLSFHFM